MSKRQIILPKLFDFAIFLQNVPPYVRSTPSGWEGTKQCGEHCASRSEPVTMIMSDSHCGLLADRRAQDSEEYTKQPAVH